MKTRTITLLSLILICFVSCDYMRDFEDPFDEHYTVTARKNGKPFRATGAILWNADFQDTPMGMYITTVSPEGYLREHLRAAAFSPVMNEYFVASTCKQESIPGCMIAYYSTLQADGDVLEDFYYTDDDNPGYVRITDIDMSSPDTADWTVSGVFDIGFVIQNHRPKVNPKNPDRIVFKNGKFKLRILFI